MMLSCRKAAELTSEALDRKLGLRERAALRLHMFMCRICWHYERQLHFLRRALTRLADAAEVGERLDPAARERIRDRLRRLS